MGLINVSIPLQRPLSGCDIQGSSAFWTHSEVPHKAGARGVMPGAQHAIEYHVITQGSCWISVVDGAPFKPVELREGDIAVIPHGEAHAVSSAPGMRAKPNVNAHRRPKDESDLPFKLEPGAGNEAQTRLICGFFTCDV